MLSLHNWVAFPPVYITTRDFFHNQSDVSRKLITTTNKTQLGWYPTQNFHEMCFPSATAGSWGKRQLFDLLNEVKGNFYSSSLIALQRQGSRIQRYIKIPQPLPEIKSSCPTFHYRNSGVQLDVVQFNSNCRWTIHILHKYMGKQAVIDSPFECKNNIL